MEKLTILLDENIERLDSKLTRVSLCAVEIPDDHVRDELIDSMRRLATDTVRFGKMSKFHFSSFSEAQRFSTVEVFSKINVTAKIFTYYYFEGSETEHKVASAINAIENLQHIHKGKKLKILLEHADEYRGSPLQEFLLEDEEIFLAPDCFLSVFIGKLNNTSSKLGANDRMYSLIKEKIRLQVFSFAGKKFYLKSNKRI